MTDRLANLISRLQADADELSMRKDPSYRFQREALRADIEVLVEALLKLRGGAAILSAILQNIDARHVLRPSIEAALKALEGELEWRAYGPGDPKNG